METASLSTIKKALSSLTPGEITDICLRLARYRKENKELVSYLIFEADDTALFIKHAKQDIDHQFEEINLNSIYLAKKTIRKVLNLTNKYIKFAGSKQTEAELLLHFCQSFNKTGVPIRQFPVTNNLYNRQIQRIQKAILSLHEDLQYDYRKRMDEIL